MAQEYDIVIIGGGPAGLTAGIYAARARRSTLLIERETFGGQIANTEMVENYPGFPEGINGLELGLKMQEQASKFGMEMAFGEVESVDLKSNPKVVKTTDEEYTAKAVIIAGGWKPKVLGIPGEEEFNGSGVAYCAMCDGPQFAGQEIAVIGGGDAGVEEGTYLTRYVNKVTVVEIMPKLTAAKIVQEAAKANPKMAFITNTAVESINGEGGQVKSITLKNNATGEKSELAVDGVFMYCGQEPNVQYLQGVLNLDKGGFIITNDMMETGIAGVYAAGDIRQKSARQVVTACGDGATAAHNADKYLDTLEG
ncbi:MAG: thioredoxin-disulfide reductase [Chloroflexota bacterium]